MSGGTTRWISIAPGRGKTMDKRTPKFFCRRTGRECCLCLIGHIKRVWECKNLIIREDGADKWN